MSLAAYKLVHFFGLFLVLLALGATLGHVLGGGDRASHRVRGLMGALHGVGLIISLVGGFGMLARSGLANPVDFPLWVWLKFVIWILFGGATAVIYRQSQLAKALLLVLPLLAVAAAYLAAYQPFL